MRIILFILSLLSVFYSCSVKNNPPQIYSEIKKLLIGKWTLTTDEDFVIYLKDDSIIYYYNSQIDEKNYIKFLFNDSLYYYKTKNNAFDFMKKGKLHSMIKIIEYTNYGKDTIVNTVVYIDKKGMDIIGRNKSISFKKCSPDTARGINKR